MQLTFPVSSDTLCLWMADNSKELKYTTIRNYLHGIATTHVELGHKSPILDSPLIWKMYKAIKRLQGSTIKQIRLPITTAILLKIESHFNLNDETHRCIRAAIWLGTCGLLRSGEFATKGASAATILKVQHLSFISAEGIYIRSYDITSLAAAAYMQIQLEQSKTDPFRQGVTVIVSNRNAIAAMSVYLARRVHTQGNQPLFIEAGGKPLSVKTLVTATQVMLTAAGIPEVHKYKGHSFRKGGATSLHTAGVPDSVIRIMGRWRSFAFARYVDTPMHTIIEAGHSMTAGN